MKAKNLRRQRTAVAFYFLACFVTFNATAAKPASSTKVLFGLMGGPFWKRLEQFSELAAKDLGYQYRKIFFVDEIASSYISRLEKEITTHSPDIFFYRPMPILNEQLYSLMERLRKKGFHTPKIVLFNGFYETNKVYDLRKLPKFTGEILPDEQKWARKLAERGLDLVSRRMSTDKQKAETKYSIGTVIIGGQSKEFVSRLRTNAMSSLVKNHPSAELLQVLDDGWNLEAMKKSAPFISRKFPDAKLLISALAEFQKDLISLYKRLGEKLPVHVSHDWTDGNIRMLKSGWVDAIAGGHFIEIGCLLLDDYLHRTYKTPHSLMDKTTKSDMSILSLNDANSIDEWLNFGKDSRWRFKEIAHHLQKVKRPVSCQFKKLLSNMKEIEAGGPLSPAH